MMKAKLVRDTPWFPPWATEAAEVEPAGTVGTISECDCSGHEWDYHFYPERLTDDTFFGVFDEEIEIMEEEKPKEIRVDQWADYEPRMLAGECIISTWNGNRILAITPTRIPGCWAIEHDLGNGIGKADTLLLVQWLKGKS